MTDPLMLAFAPQRAANELEVIAYAGKRELFKTYFRCRTGQTLRPTADALFCLGLYPASEIGAPLHVRGPVDGGLLSRVDAITGLFQKWWPSCQMIKVDAEQSEAEAATGPRRSGLFFSGGVDSCFSLLDAGDRLSALITIIGVDVPVSDGPATARLETMCREMAASRDLEPIIVETNVSQAFHPFASWIEHHGSALSAIGHMLSDHLERVLIASSGNEASWNVPWGSHPALDPMLGSRHLAVEHNGLVSRFDKIARVSADNELMKFLRVCNRSRRNCGECDKCTFVMRSFEILGWKQADTFPPFAPRRGRLKIVDSAFLSEMDRLRQAAQDAGCSQIFPEISQAMTTYRRHARLRWFGYNRWRSWSRVLRHRARWRKVCL